MDGKTRLKRDSKKAFEKGKEIVASHDRPCLEWDMAHRSQTISDNVLERNTFFCSFFFFRFLKIVYCWHKKNWLYISIRNSAMPEIFMNIYVRTLFNKFMCSVCT